MDNQSTSPQLIFPNVPDDFCPTGDWSNIFQLFIDNVLANGTINVPGLGDINPEEITLLQNQVTSQGLQIDANSANIGTNTEDINNLETNVNANTISIININTSIININGDITNIQSDVGALQVQSNATQSALAATQASVLIAQSDIINLQTNVTNLQARPVVTVRTGIQPVGAGTSTIIISFPELPSTNYGISIQAVGTSTNHANIPAYVIDAVQTTTSFTIYIQNNPATTPNLRWTVIHTS